MRHSDESDFLVENDTTNVPSDKVKHYESSILPGKLKRFHYALDFALQTFKMVVQRWGDENTLSFQHTMMVFLWHIARRPATISEIEHDWPWELTAKMLNTILRECDDKVRERAEDVEFPGPEKGGLPRPLPEDYSMRGLIYADDYFTEGWFENDKIDDEEKYMPQPSMNDERRERILWLGYRLISLGPWLHLVVDEEASEEAGHTIYMFEADATYDHYPTLSDDESMDNGTSDTEEPSGQEDNDLGTLPDAEPEDDRDPNKSDAP